jgi:2,3-bisphosphoglycerate-independent phosphoglycerate mutase
VIEMKTLFLLLDGLGDIRDNKKPTPLEMAKKPNMDRLAKEGALGQLHSLGFGIKPGSDTSQLAIFGYDIMSEYPGRGPLEALGAGVDFRPGDVAFRVNFATVDKGMKLVDRRAGRIDSQTAKALEKHINGMEIEKAKIIFKSTVEHRGVLIIRGDRLSGRISDTDPHEANVKMGISEPLDTSAEAKRTARILNEAISEACKRLGKAPENLERARKGLHPANAILCRGAGEYAEVEKFEDRHGLKAACVAGGALYRGIARYIGMDVIMFPGPTGKRYDVYAHKKAEMAVKASKDHDFVFLHVKATDNYGHDGNREGKKSVIEEVDRVIIPVVKDKFDIIVITGDHSTPCLLKAHSGHPNPFLAWGRTVRQDKTRKFDEYAAMEGGIGNINGEDVMQLILNWMDKNRKIGE